MKVVCVDDEKILLDSTVKLVGKIEGVDEVKGFSKASELLKYIDGGETADVAVLDINIGDADGISLAKKLKEKLPNINVIFATGYSEYMADAFGIHASGYLMKPINEEDLKKEFSELRNPIPESSVGIRVKAFGHFEVFANGKPIAFRREKSKELLAILVDREGASLTVEQLSAILWEDKYYDRTVKSMFNVIKSAMIADLKAVGADGMIIKSWGHLAADTSKFTCDAYEYREGSPKAISAFTGEYMSNYSWAEERVGEFYF